MRAKTILLCTSLLATSLPAYAEELSGSWDLEVTEDRRGLGPLRIEFMPKGDRFTGRGEGRRPRKFSGRLFSTRKKTLVYFVEISPHKGRGPRSAQAPRPRAIYSGTLDGDRIEGTRHSARGQSKRFAMTRVKDKPIDFEVTWLDLPASENGCWKGRDNFPNGTGMRMFYCHLSSLMSYKSLLNSAGIKIFRSGPHTENGLNLNSSSSFGHYNPKFVRWVADKALIGAKNKSFRKRTQRIYDKYMQELARLYMSTRLMLKSNESYYAKQTKSYTNFERHRPDPAYTTALSDQWPGLYRRAHAFWIRRRIDGSANAFEDALRKLMRTYDRDILQELESIKWVGGPPSTAPTPTIPPLTPGTTAQVKKCRDVLIKMGHSASYIKRCKGVENRCAVASLEAGHHPSNLRYCKRSLAPKCTVTMLGAGHHPSYLRYCGGVDAECAVGLLKRGDSPTKLRNCR